MQMSTDQKNLYEVLGLPRDAGQDLIEKQCTLLGEWNRPDKNPGDLRVALIFAQIEKAYQTLTDPVKRAAYDADLRNEAIGQDHAAFVGPFSASVNSASAVTAAAGGSEDISLHSKINSWIALLFLLAVFKVLSDVLSKFAAKWLQTNNFEAANVAFVGGTTGVIAAFVAAVMFGRFLAGIIPLWPPLSGILRTRGAAEITQGKRILATLAMLVLVPVVLVGGFIATDSQKNESARIAAEARGQFSIHGLGATECSEYLAYRQKENTNYNGATARTSAEWALGYISGYNSATYEILTHNIPVTTVVAYLDKFCRDQPLSNVSAAVGCLHGNFGGPPLPYCK
jgi:hypothetical protein